MAQAYAIWSQLKLNSLCFWAFDQFCLNSRPVPLQTAAGAQQQQAVATAAAYHKPAAARAAEARVATPVVITAASGGLNRFASNTRSLNE
jgi:hypothetical protein